MLRALYTSSTGMKAQELVIDNTANNLANVNTNGFKRSQIDFADMLYVTLRQAGTEVAVGQQTPTGVQLGSGVRVVGTTKLFTPGTTDHTGNRLDVAIQGDGFFRVQMPNGEFRYTRDGAFRIDANGRLVTGDGYLLADGVNIPQNADLSTLQIGADGTVSGLTAGVTTLSTFGNIQLTKFANPAGLSSEGSNLYAETPASGPPTESTPGLDGTGELLQSHLERSNVEVVTELVNLITAQRAYEVNSRAIRAGDEMLSTTSDIVR